MVYHSITKIIIIYCQHVNIVIKIINTTLLQSLKRTKANSVLPGITVGNHYPAGTVVRFYPIYVDCHICPLFLECYIFVFLKTMILTVTMTKALTITTVTMKE